MSLTQRVLFNAGEIDYSKSDEDILQQKYDLIKDVSGLNNYNNYIRAVKNLTKLAEYEDCINNKDFAEKSQYVTTLNRQKALWYEQGPDGMYEYINGHGSEVQNLLGVDTDGLAWMNKKQISIYNYLYSKDPEEAKNYINLLKPSLTDTGSQIIYSNIKDSHLKESATKLMYGSEKIIQQYENFWGVRDDADGIPLPSTSKKVNSMITVNTEGGWKYVYGIAELVGTAIPGEMVGIATGGVGFAFELGAEASLYGFSTAGEVKTDMLQNGYTRRAATNASTKEGLETAGTIVALGTLLKGPKVAKKSKIVKEGAEKAKIGAENARAALAEKATGIKNKATEGFDKGLQSVDNVISESKQSAISGLERSANNLSNLLDPYGRQSPEMQLAGTDINMRVSDLGIVETKPGVRVNNAEINITKTGGETGKVAGQKLNGVEQAEVGSGSKIGNSSRLIPGKEGITTGGSSKKLGENLFESMGLNKNTSRKGYQAQHIIPKELKEHPILKKIGMDFDDASNGIFLKERNGNISATSRHQGRHSQYTNVIESELDMLDINMSVEELEKEVYKIQQVSKEMMESGIPIYQIDHVPTNANKFGEYEKIVRLSEKIYNQTGQTRTEDFIRRMFEKYESKFQYIE